MNRMQIGFVLGMKVLGIPVNVDNYRRICNAVYLAEQNGVYIAPSRVLFDEKTGMAYSPKSHESGGNPSWNLRDDVEEIERDLRAGIDESTGRTLDDKSRKILEGLKDKIDSLPT